MDSLRYWVLEMHVDGFRFDLASALAREFWDVDRLSAFFDIIHQDPVLSQVKLIAEPWDVGPGGYQVGNFPVLWTEWNGLYRDEMRDFWRGHSDGVAELRLAPHGLERPLPVRRAAAVRVDQLHHRPRRLHAGRPRLLQREAQRGQPRGQPRRHRRQPQLELRRRGPDRRSGDHRAARAPAAQLPGDPAALAGRADAAGRRRDGPHPGRQQQRLLPGQRDLAGSTGTSTSAGERLLDFTRRLIELRRAHPVFHRRDFFGGQSQDGSGLPDIRWFRADGREMSRRDWRSSELRVLGVFLNGEEIPSPNPVGEPVVDDSFVMLVNAGARGHALPPPGAPLRQPLAAGDLDRRARRARGLAQLAGALGGDPRSPLGADPPPHLVRATYRLQLGPDLDFADARALVPYLRRLGVSHLYLSPSLQARSGSTHGYDVTDPRRISADLGGEDGFRGPGGGRARRSCSTSCPTTWPPTTRTRSGPTRRCASATSTSIRTPAGTGASSPSTSSPACGWRTRRSSR